MTADEDGEAKAKEVANMQESALPRPVVTPAEGAPDMREIEFALQRYTDLYDFAPTGYVSFDRSGRIAEANLTAAELLGVTRHRLIGMPFAVFVFREDAALFLHHLLQCRCSEARVETELRLKNVKRDIIHTQLSSTPINASPHNGALLFQTNLINLTDRKAAEAALREKDAELELIVAHTPFMLTRCTRDLRYRYVSSAYAEMIGRRPDEIAGKPIVEVMGKKGLAAIRPYIERVLSGETVTYEYVISYKGAGKHFLSAAYVPDKNERGEVIGWIASMIDIGERKKAEERFRSAVEASPSGMIMVDQEGKMALVNSQAERLFGYTREEVLGKPVKMLMPERFREQFLALPKAKTLQAESELFGLRKTGTEVAIEIGLNPIRIGGQRFVLVSIVDITDRKKAQAALADADRQRTALYEFSRSCQNVKSFDEIYQAALTAITSALQCDRASILLYDDQQVMRFVASRGLSARYRKAVEGHSHWKPGAKNPQPITISDVRRADLPKSLQQTIRREGIRAAAFVPLISDGKLIGKFMAYHRVPHVFNDAELKLATTIARHLAQAIEHERDEEALRESEARMRATVEQTTAGMGRYDTDGRIVFANHRFCQMLGYTESELIGKTIVELTHPDDSQENISLFRQLIRDGKPFDVEKRYIRKNGSILWGHVSVSPVRDVTGEIKSAVAVAVDVTARKQAEAGLQKSKGLLEQRVRERTHELHKTNKQLRSEMERRKGLEGEILSVSDREQQRLGQELHDGLCQHLTAVAFMTRSIALRLRHHRVIDAADIEKVAELVNQAAVDTRNLSRALHRVDVDAASLITALQDLVDREIWRTACRLEAKPSFRMDDDAAAAHLYRIAREAVINANKHAQARQIVVRLERVRNQMVLRIIDDGVGLSKELKPQQGLGFHIMNYRAQLMGGRLEIDSPQTGGTRVSCYLPIDPPRSRKASNGDQPDAATPKHSKVPVATDLTLRHLKRQGAANA